jgi:hypothetical protein
VGQQAGLVPRLHRIRPSLPLASRSFSGKPEHDPSSAGSESASGKPETSSLVRRALCRHPEGAVRPTRPCPCRHPEGVERGPVRVWSRHPEGLEQ